MRLPGKTLRPGRTWWVMFGPGGATVFMLGTAALSAVESRIRGGTVESVAVARKGGGIVVDVVAII